MPDCSKTIYGKKTPAEVRAAIQQICEEMDYDPFKELIRIATESVKTNIDGVDVNIPVADVDQKIMIAKEIASYIAPKIKGIEVKHDVQGGIKFEVTHFFEDGRVIDLPDSRNLRLAESVKEAAIVEVGADQSE